ncbi:MAG: DUF4293 domain-containing protein [Bacteroidota bacterium]
MIQRLQSLLFLLAAVLMISLFYFKIASFTNEGSTVNLDLCYVKGEDAFQQVPSIGFVTYAPYIVLGLAILLIVTIFMYANRKRQILLANVCFIINLGYLALTLMAPDQLKEKLMATTGNTGEWEQHIGPGSIIPIISIALIIMATRFIKKDEALVKAADRLR